jgi:hypothetical protein
MRRRSFRKATAMIVAVGGALLISVNPRAGAEPVDLELVNPAGVRPVPWLWATLDATWFGPRTPAPGEWCWRGERRALACDATNCSTAECTLADGEGFAPVLSSGVGTFPGGACGGGGGGGGVITVLALASCTTPLTGVSSAGSSIGEAADLGFSTGGGGWKSAPAALMTVQYSGALADALPYAEEAPVSAPLVAAETNIPAVVTTPLPTAALSGMTVLGGVGLFGRRRASR